MELGFLFYCGTTEWGAAVKLPGESPVLTDLARRAPAGLIAGDLGDLPVRLGLRTGSPYLGFAHMPLNRLLLRLQDRPLKGKEEMTDARSRGWHGPVETIAKALAGLTAGRLARHDPRSGSDRGPLE